MCNKTLIIPPENQNKVKGERYNSLDGLRAYAALGIILMHVLANISVKPSANYLTERLIPFFTDFTLLFMIVSGFSLCCGYYTRIKDGTITPNAFYRKRYLRILPFFALLCLIDLVFEPDLGSLCEVFANMTLCFGLLPPDTEFHVIGVGWFLGVVFLFYILFPFFVFMLNNRRRAWISFALAVVFVLVSSVHFGASGRRCMVFCAPLFIAGGVTYLYRHSLADFGRRHTWSSLTGVTFITIFFFVANEYVHCTFVNYLLELALFGAWLVYAVGSRDKVLNNRVARYLSGISMEIYLSHMLVYRAVEKLHLENRITQHDLLYIVTALLTIIGVICFAHVMKYYVVQPIMKKIEKQS
jgi:peptidoglycan/LPS O-acetylase OafA/YrhL